MGPLANEPISCWRAVKRSKDPIANGNCKLSTTWLIASKTSDNVNDTRGSQVDRIKAWRRPARPGITRRHPARLHDRRMPIQAVRHHRCAQEANRPSHNACGRRNEGARGSIPHQAALQSGQTNFDCTAKLTPMVTIQVGPHD